jgi:hypothetical protein
MEETMEDMIRIVLGQEIFDTSVTFQNSEGKICSYGARGLPVLKIRGVNGRPELIGLQANNPEYSWGVQIDGSYIDVKVHESHNGKPLWAEK